jgi:hypothetical protein
MPRVKTLIRDQMIEQVQHTFQPLTSRMFWYQVLSMSFDIWGHHNPFSADNLQEHLNGRFVV